MREQNLQERNLNEGHIKDLQDKIVWYRENQKIISEQQAKLTTQGRDLQKLQLKMKDAEVEKAKAKEYEKKIVLLEETIKARNPNSIPMLIHATKEVKQAEEDEKSKKHLKFRIQ